MKQLPNHERPARLPMDFTGLAIEFREILCVEPPDDNTFKKKVEEVLTRLSHRAPVTVQERRIRLLALVNSKFDINASGIENVFALAAKINLTLNYHDKRRISTAFDRADQSVFDGVLESKGIADAEIRAAFCPMPSEKTLNVLHAELVAPTLTRKDSRARDRSSEIRRSLFGGFVFSAFDQIDMHQLFDSFSGSEYEPEFWTHLHKNQRGLFSREKTLVYFDARDVTDENVVVRTLEKEFEELANHGYFALYLGLSNPLAWRLSALATLFAEKFIAKRINQPYFNWREIESTTRAYISDLDIESAKFEVAHLGYHYRDTFVIGDGDGLLLIFQKNVPDETLIPCPSCRSHKVQGNSYPSIGVKSWECNNPICPDRSKFDRGKRYSFLQLLKQQAIEDPDALIPKSSVRLWARDVQPFQSDQSIVEMLLRHFTLPGDGVNQIGGPRNVTSLGRMINYTPIERYVASLEGLEGRVNKFRASEFFRRFSVNRRPTTSNSQFERTNCCGIELVRGDSFHVLASVPDASFDGAITSPPYYNAREYSQWPNVYCYLYDMYNITREVFRTLKPGALYLFNIFDYFDNEKTIVSSAMGDKRMILSAYCVDLFERSGFSCEGNIVWDKGEIEGKRAFNNGNYSPFYQAPFNCWEHILVFKKPGSEVKLCAPLPRVLRQKPVIKMVRGVNRHGHSAPFPDQIPALLLERLKPTSTVLDPFAGSMTTGRVAFQLGHKAMCIESDPEYFELGCSRLQTSTAQLSLINKGPPV